MQLLSTGKLVVLFLITIELNRYIIYHQGNSNGLFKSTSVDLIFKNLCANCIISQHPECK